MASRTCDVCGDILPASLQQAPTLCNTLALPCVSRLFTIPLHGARHSPSKTRSEVQSTSRSGRAAQKLAVCSSRGAIHVYKCRVDIPRATRYIHTIPRVCVCVCVCGRDVTFVMCRMPVFTLLAFSCFQCQSP